MTMNLNPETLNILEKFGWSKSRTVDISKYQTFYSNTNQPVSSEILEFLRSFGNLRIREILVDPITPYKKWGDKHLNYYQKWIGKPIVYVGIIDDSVLFMSSDGAFYSQIFEYVNLLGENTSRFLNNMLSNRPIKTSITMPTEMRPKPVVPPLRRDLHFDIKSNEDWKPIFRKIVIKDIELEMCKVPAGMFIMGLDNFDRRSSPQHYQYLMNPYWISKHPITNKQWRYAVENSMGEIEKPRKVEWYDNPTMSDHPVVWISGENCWAFANWLENDFRLPSEPEWEFAARGPDNLLYPFGNVLQQDIVVDSSNSIEHPISIGGRPNGASWVGAEDMLGNVWEWVDSVQASYPYPTFDEIEQKKLQPLWCTQRGGSYRTYTPRLNLSSRSPRPSHFKQSDIGFRLVTDRLPV